MVYSVVRASVGVPQPLQQQISNINNFSISLPRVKIATITAAATISSDRLIVPSITSAATTPVHVVLPTFTRWWKIYPPPFMIYDAAFVLVEAPALPFRPCTIFIHPVRSARPLHTITATEKNICLRLTAAYV